MQDILILCIIYASNLKRSLVKINRKLGLQLLLQFFRVTKNDRNNNNNDEDFQTKLSRKIYSKIRCIKLIYKIYIYTSYILNISYIYKMHKTRTNYAPHDRFRMQVQYMVPNRSRSYSVALCVRIWTLPTAIMLRGSVQI